MTLTTPLTRTCAAIAAGMVVVAAVTGAAQQRAGAPDPAALQEPESRLELSLTDRPQVLLTATGKIRVVPIKGFVYPWAIAFLPDGSMLVSEKGRTTLRIVRNGVLDPKPITGL